MDDIPPPARPPGGALEPANREAVLKSQFRIPDAPTPLRFELRDPFADVTYRSNSFEEMVVRADRLGAFRFVSIDPDGKRTTVTKEEGQWQRPVIRQPQPPAAERSGPVATAAATVPSPDREEDKPLVATPDPSAERRARVARLEADLSERYVIKRAPLRIGDVMIGQTEYRHRGDTSRLAFTESTFRLSTETNSPSVARSMVDVAEARHWKAIRVSGSDDFRRTVWLEASLRHVNVVGYDPAQSDQELLRRERSARPGSRSVLTDAPAPTSSAAAKQSSRGGGRKAVLAALEAVLIARHIPAHQRVAVMAAAEQTLARRTRNGETFRVKVYDPSAPSQRPTVTLPREHLRSRERVSPTR